MSTSGLGSSVPKALPERRELTDNPAATVVIPVWQGDYDKLPWQLGQLSRQDTDVEFEVLISDNSGGLVASGVLDNGLLSAGAIRVVDSSARRGVVFARNRAIADASSEIVMICDADDLVSRSWVREMCTALADHEFVTGPCRRVDIDDPQWVQALEGAWTDEAFPVRPYRHEGVDFASGGNHGLHRSLVLEVGGYPEHYVRMQDVAFSLMLRERGREGFLCAGGDCSRAEADRVRSWPSAREVRERAEQGETRT